MITTRMTSAHIKRAVLAGATALAVLTAMPTSSAHAATGTFSSHSPESGDLEINNPGNGECYLLLQGADSATNGTDTTATVFYDRGCEEPADTGAALPGLAPASAPSSTPHGT